MSFIGSFLSATEGFQHLEDFSTYISCRRCFGKPIISPLVQSRGGTCKYKMTFWLHLLTLEGKTPPTGASQRMKRGNLQLQQRSIYLTRRVDLSSHLSYIMSQQFYLK